MFGPRKRGFATRSFATRIKADLYIYDVAIKSRRFRTESLDATKFIRLLIIDVCERMQSCDFNKCFRTDYIPDCSFETIRQDVTRNKINVDTISEYWLCNITTIYTYTYI